MTQRCGDDSATLTEIAAALRFIGEQPHPDLGAALRLALHRDELFRRNWKIPVELPVAWARLGEFARAEAMARTLSNPPGSRDNALLSLAEVAFAAGDAERGLRLADEVAEATPYASMLCAVARVLARAGERERARRLVDQAEENGGLSRTGYPHAVIETRIAVGQADRAEEIMRTRGRSVAAIVALAGAETDPERRSTLLDEALAKAGPRPDPADLVTAFGAAAKAWAGTAEGQRLVDRARTLADSPYADVRAERLCRLGLAMARAGDPSGARRLLAAARAELKSISYHESLMDEEAWGADPTPDEQWFELMIRVGETLEARALADSWARQDRDQPRPRFVRALIRVGPLDQAEAAVRSSLHADEKTTALARLAARAAGAGDPDRARRLAVEAESLARGAAPDVPGPELIVLAEALAEAGDLARAESSARLVREARPRLTTLLALADRWAGAGDPDQAHRLVREVLGQIRAITGQNWAGDRRDVWAKAVRVCTGLGDPGLAEQVGYGFADASDQAWVRRLLAEAWIEAGDLPRAETTVRDITKPHLRREPLALVARAWIEAGDLARAETIALDDLPDSPADLLVALARAWLAAGDPGRAEGVAQRSRQPAGRAFVLAALAESWPRLVDPALEAARAAAPATERFRALLALIGVLGKLGARDRTAVVAAEAVEVVRAELAPRQARNGEAALLSLAAALVDAGERERAEDIVVALPAPPIPSQAVAALRTLTTVAEAWAAAGDFDRARTTLAHCPAFYRPQALAALATAAFRAGDPERMRRLFEEAEAAGHALADPEERLSGLTGVACAWVGAGDPERAEATIHAASPLSRRSWPWDVLAEALVAAGEPARAAALAPAITDPNRRAALLHRLVADADPDQLRRQVAAALADTPARTLLPVLARVDPAAVIAATA
jgi:hypothetical protein